MKCVRILFYTALLGCLVFAVSCSTTNPSNNVRGCSGCQFVYATTNASQILTFTVSSSGALGSPAAISGPANSTGIFAWGSTVYVSDPANKAIQAYTISHVDGSLSPASFGPYPVSSSPGDMAFFGGTLYAASATGSIFAFTMNADGSLSSLAGSPFAAGSGLSHLEVVNLSNSNFLYGANSDDANGSISAFTIAANGTLTAVAGSPFPTVANGSPEAFYEIGSVLYIALKNANAVAALTVNADGTLTPLAGSPFPAGRGTTSLNGAGGFLYATNNLDGTISSYSINQVSGSLTHVNGSPFSAAIPSGDMIYDNGRLFLPDASSNSISGFTTGSTGNVSALMGSPFMAGSGPLALTSAQFPVIDPP